MASTKTSLRGEKTQVSVVSVSGLSEKVRLEQGGPSQRRFRSMKGRRTGACSVQHTHAHTATHTKRERESASLPNIPTLLGHSIQRVLDAPLPHPSVKANARLTLRLSFAAPRRWMASERSTRCPSWREATTLATLQSNHRNPRRRDERTADAQLLSRGRETREPLLDGNQPIQATLATLQSRAWRRTRKKGGGRSKVLLTQTTLASSLCLWSGNPLQPLPP
ncbi:hypothetical protein RTBOTA2_000739 [Rhodotorula toruloides]|nr:hypothetical protein RTBOTA2_000739 [Rhodotorula toruloides]